MDRRWCFLWVVTGLVAVALLIATLGLAARAQTTPAGPTTAVLTSSGTPIYLRADPGLSARILAVLAPGTEVDVHPADGDPTPSWQRITVDGRTGWVPTSNVVMR